MTVPPPLNPQLALIETHLKTDIDRTVATVANALASLGSNLEWDSDIFQDVTEQLAELARAVLLPEIDDQSPGALSFYMKAGE